MYHHFSVPINAKIFNVHLSCLHNIHWRSFL